ncbi:MAG: N-acetylmuramoyl-L-alanine amidase [Deltaproteobacteria bacterium]|nr:N-acetylmuramoyl-L-alanine amidase [Deltaproteobacteria bacterium]
MTRSSRRLLLAVVAFTLLAPGERPPGLGDVTGVRVFSHDTHTRVVIDLSRSAEWHTGFVADPPRYYVDIEETWIEPEAGEPHALSSTEVVRKVRGGQNTLRKARVVVELDRPGRVRETFEVRSPHPFRIVTDIFHDGAPPPRHSRVARGPASFDRRPVRSVVIDPGHGGKDPGAIGSRGLREKDVVLRVARELAKRLRAEGLEVHLTRDKDVFIPLDKRTLLANQWKGDLFVSIHANASRNRKSNGVETYLLDTRYDKNTARVAARENGTTVAELNDLQRILASLRLSYSERYAAPLAEKVHTGLMASLRGKYGKTRDLGVKRGPFVVLFQADMPAILVEVGFVTNRSESKRLRGRAFARTVSDGIAAGILRYRDSHARSIVAGR